jgi:nucleotide-binding universal stress UspA family protein
MLRIERILLPTDFSAPSQYAFQLACSLARDHGSRVIVLHVVLTLGPEFVPHGEAVSQLEPESHRNRLWAEVSQVKPADAAIAVEHQLAEGDPAVEIARAAVAHDCQLIVMGTHGRTGLDRLLVGSVAEQVMRKAHCPVLVVKAPQSSSPS